MLHRYFIKTPWWIRRIFSSYVWSMPAQDKVIYLTFDDGPHPEITPFVLNLLRRYNARASFFCIGSNVERYPGMVQTILSEGHSIGNHTQHHLNGWKTETSLYLTDVADAACLLDTHLFRPPYGRIRKRQAKGIAKAMNKPDTRIIMWDVLSADFDQSIPKEACLANVLEHTGSGSIVVFHDSEKAYPHLSYVLPKALEKWEKEGYRFLGL